MSQDYYDCGGIPPTPGVSMQVFTGIPSDRCEEFWPIIEPVIYRAILRTDGRHTAVTTRRAIIDDKMQLWAAFSDPEMKTCTAALVTETLQYPSGKEECEIVFCAGRVIPDCLPLLDQIEAWAKSVGCSGMRLHGRKGWGKILSSYEESSVVLRKAL